MQKSISYIFFYDIEEVQRNIFLQSYSAVLSTYLFGLEDDEPAFALGFDSAELMVEEDKGNNLLNVWMVFLRHVYHENLKHGEGQLLVVLNKRLLLQLQQLLQLDPTHPPQRAEFLVARQNGRNDFPPAAAPFAARPPAFRLSPSFPPAPGGGGRFTHSLTCKRASTPPPSFPSLQKP